MRLAKYFYNPSENMNIDIVPIKNSENYSLVEYRKYYSMDKKLCSKEHFNILIDIKILKTELYKCIRYLNKNNFKELKRFNGIVKSKITNNTLNYKENKEYEVVKLINDYSMIIKNENNDKVIVAREDFD